MDDDYIKYYLILKRGLFDLLHIVVDKEQYVYLHYEDDEDLLDLLLRKVMALKLLVSYLFTLALTSLTIVIALSIIK